MRLNFNRPELTAKVSVADRIKFYQFSYFSLRCRSLHNKICWIEKRRVKRMSAVTAPAACIKEGFSFPSLEASCLMWFSEGNEIHQILFMNNIWWISFPSLNHIIFLIKYFWSNNIFLIKNDWWISKKMNS